MRRLLSMDWPSRLAIGLLAWPVLIFLTAQLSYFVQPGAFINGPLVAVLALAEVLAALIAIAFTIWALFTWGESGDDLRPHRR